MPRPRRLPVTALPVTVLASAALVVAALLVPLPAAAAPPGEPGEPGTADARSIRMITRDADGGPTDGDAFVGGTSRDGSLVTFMSFATDLVPDDDNGEADVFLTDASSGATSLLSRTPAGEPANGESIGPVLSPDGRWVAHYSAATDLVDGADDNATTDVFLTRVADGRTLRASTSVDGAAGSGESSYPAVSGRGRYVAYQSWADDLVAGDTNGVSDLFVLDRRSGETTMITNAPDGSPADNFSDHPSISRDGRFVAFTSAATNLVADKTTPWNDIFVHDRETGETTLISRTPAGQPAGSNSFDPSISPDGRYVVYMSRASDLTSDVDTNFVGDIFRHDRETGETILISRSTGGGTAVAESHEPSISRNGKVITFYSYAWDLVADDVDDWWGDVYMLRQRRGELVKITESPVGDPADFHSANAHVSADGSTIAFSSGATNLVAGDTNGLRDAFVR